MYYAFIHPYIIYGNIIWGNASAIALWPIFKLQKVALRMITNTPRGKSTQNQAKKLRILRLPDTYTYSSMIFMFKYTNNMMPASLTGLFQKNSAVHSYNTRGASNLRIPRVHTLLAEKFITFTGVKLWNSLNPQIISTGKISNFKAQLISLLIKDYRDSN